MYQLSTLGRIDLVGPDETRISSVLQQAKRVALLAYLAIEGGGRPVRRDTLLVLFWPESGEHQARNSLKQAIFHLRRSLGDSALPKDGADTVRVDPAVLGCDAVSFAEACRACRWQEALDLYGGDLLPGLNGDLSPEFESWLDLQRFELRARAADAGIRLAGQIIERGGDPIAATLPVRRALELAYHDEARVREGLRLLAAAGNGATVADEYARFKRRLRDDLGVEPDAETVALVRELGCMVDVEEDQPGSRGEGAGVSTPGLLTRRRAEWRPRLFAMSRNALVSGAVGTLLLLVAGSFLVSSWRASESNGFPAGGTEFVPQIDVQPFQAAEDSGAAAVARVLPGLLRHRLAEADGIAVRASTGLVPVDGPSTIVFAVEGVVQTVPGEVSVHVSVSDPVQGWIVASRSFVRQSADSTSEVELSADIAAWLRSAIGWEMRAKHRSGYGRRARAVALLDRAEDAQRRARSLRTRGQLEAARRGFEEADSLAAVAVAADPDWIEPILARARIAGDRAWVALLSVPPDTMGVRIELERALEMADRAVARSPADPAAIEARGLMADRLRALTPVDEDQAAALVAAARSDFERAVALDRRRVRSWSALSLLAYLEADYAGALWTATTAYELDRYLENAPEILFRLFASAFEVGDDYAAERWCNELRARYPGQEPGLYCALGILAWKDTPGQADVDAAWALLAAAEHAPFLPAVQPRLEMMIASILAGAGLPDSAQAVAATARNGNPSDPELLQFEAHVRLRLGQPDSARLLLDRFIAGKPSARAHILQSRRFEPLTVPPD
jgi:DNA-binding SARP family transcriptional activator/tetratricopeptide (TPR) repeat protein